MSFYVSYGFLFFFFFFLMIRRPPRSTLSSSSAASDVYKRQSKGGPHWRVSSPSRLSTLITSAPRSARIMVQKGPASTRVKSSTRTPANASGDFLVSVISVSSVVVWESFLEILDVLARLCYRVSQVTLTLSWYPCENQNKQKIIW